MGCKGASETALGRGPFVLVLTKWRDEGRQLSSLPTAMFLGLLKAYFCGSRTSWIVFAHYIRQIESFLDI